MRYLRVCLCIIMFCQLDSYCAVAQQTKLQELGDSAQSAKGKPSFLPLGLHYLQQAVEQKDTTLISDAYSAITGHYYILGKIDSLRLATYEYMEWADRYQRNQDRYQAWRQYIQRMTEKGMQEEVMLETGLLAKDAEQRKDKYGIASSEMCVGYSHRVFGRNIALCLEYYDSALKHFEEGGYYRDAYVVCLNLIQTLLSRQSYAEALPYLDRLEALDNTVKENKLDIGENLHMRYYQFRAIAVLGTEGEKAATPYVNMADQYYEMNRGKLLSEGWLAYKVMYYRLVGNLQGTLAYMDSLIAYHYSVGDCYPANYWQKAVLLENLGRYKEACIAYSEYSQLNDSVRTAEMDEQLNKYTAQFEVTKLKMEKLEMSDRMNRERFFTVLVAACLIAVLLFMVTYLYIRTLSMNKKLESANKEIQRVSHVKSSFIQHITHELRTPLNAVVGFSILLAEGEVESEEQQDYAERIEENSEYLLGLIDNIIDVADMDTQVTNLAEEIVDLKVCCNECVNIARKKIKEGVELQWSVVPEDLTVQAIYSWVKRVISILLDNAVKFTEQGSIRLTAEEDRVHNVVRLVIEDTGTGISQEDADRVFERFFKANSFLRGAGLGLAIAYQIMDIVGGKIYLDTSYVQGARFIVEWPMS